MKEKTHSLKTWFMNQMRRDGREKRFQCKKSLASLHLFHLFYPKHDSGEKERKKWRVLNKKGKEQIKLIPQKTLE